MTPLSYMLPTVVASSLAPITELHQESILTSGSRPGNRLCNSVNGEAIYLGFYLYMYYSSGVYEIAPALVFLGGGRSVCVPSRLRGSLATLSFLDFLSGCRPGVGFKVILRQLW
jgi:hypothetical protein